MREQEPADAANTLARAERLRRTVNARSRWYVRYQLIYAAAVLVTMPVLGLVGGPAGVAIAMTIWCAAIGGLSVWAARQPVSRRGFGPRHGAIIGAWAAIYVAVLIPGSTAFAGEPAWWLPGTVLAAVPSLAGAWLEARR